MVGKMAGEKVNSRLTWALTSPKQRN